MPRIHMANPRPIDRGRPHYPAARAGIILAAVIAMLFVWASRNGMGNGGWTDYALFCLWILGSMAGMYAGHRRLRRPILGAVYGGVAGNLLFLICWNVQRLFRNWSISELLHPSMTTAYGQTAILGLGIIGSVILGVATRLAVEGLSLQRGRSG